MLSVALVEALPAVCLSRFMDNLQTEVLEIEFLSFSKGMPTISEEDFARILLRYTNVDDVSGYLENVRQSIPDEKVLLSFVTFLSFKSFTENSSKTADSCVKTTPRNQHIKLKSLTFAFFLSILVFMQLKEIIQNLRIFVYVFLVAVVSLTDVASPSEEIVPAHKLIFSFFNYDFDLKHLKLTTYKW